MRHRVPSIFNLSMVDVLCCALGCVILLWLLNLREARQKAVQAGKADEQVARLKAEGDALRRQLDEARVQLGELGTKYSTTQAERDETERQLAATRRRLESVEAEARDTAARLTTTERDRDRTRARLAQLDRDLKALRDEKATIEDGLARRVREVEELEKKLGTAGTRVASLEKQLREQDGESAAASRRIDDLSARLKDAEARARSYGEKLQVRDGDLGRQCRELDDAKRSIEILEGEKKQLLSEAAALRAAADNRFAGVALTGRRVVFLVDMSGSMELIDQRTAAPGKWSGVRDTIVKVMRSLPHLEKFQVILFSDRVRYPLGGAGSWIDHDGDSTARVQEELGKVRPEGDTNMYAAFEAAFRYRPLGLDTIYVFSDGLPNIGEGLTVEQARTLRDTEQADILGKYIRQKLRSDWNRDLRGQPRVRINAIGFFFESPDVGAFLWALTRDNDGSFVGMSKP
jgi:predicted  nucleic acid-binding Zn-ribbon protein